MFKDNHVKFARFVWLAVREEAKQRLHGNLETFGFTKCLAKAENHFKNVLEIPFKNLYQTGDGSVYALK